MQSLWSNKDQTVSDDESLKGVDFPVALTRFTRLPHASEVAMSCEKLREFSRSCQSLREVARSCEKLREVARSGAAAPGSELVLSYR